MQEVDKQRNVPRNTPKAERGQRFFGASFGDSSYYEQTVLFVNVSQQFRRRAANTYVYDSLGSLRVNGNAHESLTHQSRVRLRDRDVLIRARYYESCHRKVYFGGPHGFSGGVNFYDTFVNSPVLLVDPLGLRWTNTGVPAPPNTTLSSCNGLAV